MTTKRQSRIEKWQGANGRWFWHCIAPNGNITSVGSNPNGYGSERDVDRAIDRNVSSLAAAFALGRIEYRRRGHKPKT